MQLSIDLSGSPLAQDDLDLLADARQAVMALLVHDAVLDRTGRERLAVLLHILDDLLNAVIVAALPRS